VAIGVAKASIKIIWRTEMLLINKIAQFNGSTHYIGGIARVCGEGAVTAFTP
jgi:hypothetical protein